jgi:Diacylglycerol kinase accessory domain
MLSIRLIELHHRDLFDEKCVMNSYFGIGIDAKITLDFHMKREEHPEKCRSRARNYMWYGVLGSKEWLQVNIFLTLEIYLK